jgi:8-oxo-dGTP pyrophosphatase MutT (NUDIX family)
MIERVRAVLVTPDGCLLAIRRDRPDRATYWMLPGGHVDPGDQSLEAALSREISEEIWGSGCGVMGLIGGLAMPAVP